MKRRRVRIAVILVLAAILLLSSCVQGGSNAGQNNVADNETNNDINNEASAPDFRTWLEENGAISTLSGEGIPTKDLGQPSDTYTDLSTLRVYWRGSEEWVELGSLAREDYRLVRFASNVDTELPRPQPVKKYGKITEPEAPAVPEKTFEGWYGEGITGKWVFDEDTVMQDMTLTAVYTDTVPHAAAKLTANDTNFSAAVLDGTNAAVVIYVGFTDGYVCDKEQFENFFKAEYGQEQALESVATYYKYNSYGKVSFDFYFYYCDTGMTCKEAYEYTSDESIGHKLLYDVFREFQQNYQGDPKDWDRNGDGYVDMIFFVTGEDSGKTAGKGEHHVIYGSSSPTESFKPDPEKPVIHQFSKLTYEDMLTPVKSGNKNTGIRILLHETGHLFGLVDYYNRQPYEDEETFDTLGSFDMQSTDIGDWNVYSRFTCGWLEPYVIDGSQDEVTLKIGCSSEVADAVLIPTGAGWNGTAFDEYIMIDVLAPYAANGYDWRNIYDDMPVKASDPRKFGGVRVYHVDSRLARIDQYDPSLNRPAQTLEELQQVIQDPDFRRNIWLTHRFTNSDGYDPVVEGDSRRWHLIEVVPSDGSSRLRRHSNIYGSFEAYDSLTVSDLYGPGDKFSMEICSDAFENAPLMNNGSSFDYEVEVDFYDPDTREAVITIRKIR